MAGPGDEMAVGAAGRGRMRASHADREQAIEVLKAAFAEGRLTQSELDTRVGEALVSRTHAELAVLTADIPAGLAAAESAARPAGTPARTLAKAVLRSGICMLVPFALVGVIALTNAMGLAPLAFFSGVAAVIAASGFLGWGVVDAWQERRSRGQLPGGPTPDPGGQASQRPPTARPGGQLPPPGHGRQHTAEAGRRDPAHPRSPGSRSARQCRRRGHRYTVGYVGV